jgi:hypothetical protein
VYKKSIFDVEKTFHYFIKSGPNGVPYFSFASLFTISLLFVLICWTKESTGASFSLEEEFKQLKENYVRKT